MNVEVFKTAVILAGGKSSRMGFDKQFLRVNEVRVMEKLIHELSKEFEDIIIVTNKPEDYKKDGVRIISDEIKEFGPLSGIHVGIKQSKSRYVYFIACDMPNVNLDYIRYMKKVLTNSKANACIAKREGKLEPFNAFYSVDILPEVEKLITLNKRSIAGLIDIIEPLFIEENVLKKYDYSFDMFMNLNSKEDLKGYNRKNKQEENYV
ncbi:Molybdopterin-guanine dinucleotide biosynthesis protein A [Clostridium sp. DL-VIII]|uniref:molybdenum cofactor guanylyltransferase n=1 Tax=Clostridium sp. DL-VIII TaxID=641107 RepID=UPI00023B08AD|nr:molybdenum cofactor guanylyltransferase [Clostridium sp. DL-VIII]EHJ01717.1 Molybdopterin-guanine dinucleotide biosynthesis protein A [Clostridium sp. DL-VIII]